MVVGVGVEVPVPDDVGDCPHDGRAVARHVLVVVAEDHSDLRPLQPETVRTELKEDAPKEVRSA